MAVIEATGLVKTFRTGRGKSARSVRAVSGIEFSVEAGERLAYIGPNGAGKSTSIKILASLLHEPRVLFLDEPTIGLDLVAKQRFRDLVVRLNEETGTTLFLTSHDVSDIEQVARRVIVINHGPLIYDDKVSVMRRSLLRTKLLEVRFDDRVDDLSVEGVEVVKGSGTGYKLRVDTDHRAIRHVL